MRRMVTSQARTVAAVLIAVTAMACSSEPGTSSTGESSTGESVMPVLPDGSDAGPGAAPDPDVELPEGWQLVTVTDALTGPFQVAVPDDAVGWAVGSPLTALADAATGTDWWAFWEPRLGPLTAELSNVRAMLAVPEGDDVRSVQVNVTPYDLDVPPEDAAGIAEAFAIVAEAQGGEVVDRSTVAYDGPEVDEVAQVVQQVDPEVLAREAWQRFIPAPEENALWSVQCDGPLGDDLETFCAGVLDAFRPPS